MSTPPISRGFHGRRGTEAAAGRVPQGQYVTPDFPVLSAGPTSHTPVESWSFEIRVDTSAAHILAFSDGGYSANLPLADVSDGKAWVAYEYEDEPLAPEHGGPARLLVPRHYFWKSAKWVRGIELRQDDQPGFWEGYGYHNCGDPWKEQRYAGD